MKYQLILADGTTTEFGRRDRAIVVGDKSGQSYRILSPKGVEVWSVDLEDATPAPSVEAKTSFDLEAMKDKISKLLAKAEGTDNQAERDAFTEKAERLMLKLGIQAAELESAGQVKAEEIVQTKLLYRDSYAKTMVGFTARIAEGFGNLKVLHGNVAKREQYAYVIGHQTDVDTFKQLINSLVLQAYTALKEFRKTNFERSLVDQHHRWIMDKSFLAGYGSIVGQRLTLLRTEEVAEASTGAALVLASKMDRVEEKLAELHPNVKDAKKSHETFSRIGASAGSYAGMTAKLGQDEVANKKGELS